MTVSDDNIQITILILCRGALSSKDGREDEYGRRANHWDYQVKTAALEIILGVIVVKVRSMMERTSIQTTVDIINIRVYLRRDFPSLRSDNHTICDSKHFIC